MQGMENFSNLDLLAILGLLFADSIQAQGSLCQL